MRAVKIIALVLLCVFAVLCAAMGFLLATAPGLYFLVNQAKDYLPQLTQGTFSGSLLSLDAKEVVWEQPGLRFKGDFGWHIDFNKLLSGEVVFHDFYVQNVQSTVQSAQFSSAEEKVSES